MKTTFVFLLMVAAEPLWIDNQLSALLLVMLAVLIGVRWFVSAVAERRERASDGRLVVRVLSGRGRSVPQIARELRFSQDAVRSLMAPDPAARRAIGVGNSFRYQGSSPPSRYVARAT